MPIITLFLSANDVEGEDDLNEREVGADGSNDNDDDDDDNSGEDDDPEDDEND